MYGLNLKELIDSSTTTGRSKEKYFNSILLKCTYTYIYIYIYIYIVSMHSHIILLILMKLKQKQYNTITYTEHI